MGSQTNVDNMATEVEEMEVKKQEVNEFNDGRERAPYTWGQSATDWFKQTLYPSYTDEAVEKDLLSVLPFFPASDGTRKAEVINTPVGDGNYIHEFYIENLEKPSASSPPVKDVVLVHGYAASLGLFIDNFDDLSKVPGIKIHAIDLLGFGFSSRPKFPKFEVTTKEDIYKVEDWFIDSLETWRKNRKIDRFVLIGHSFGGYLSCAYALKYNKAFVDASGHSVNPIDKLVLISPVGVERNKYSFLKSIKTPAVSAGEKLKENQESSHLRLSQEITADQENIINPTTSAEEIPSGPSKTDYDDPNASRGAKLFKFLWEKHISPFSLVRNMGPIRSKMISGWTTHRFAHTYYTDPNKFYAVHNYIYRIFNGKGSGEYAITRILAVGAVARLPLLDRCPQAFAAQSLPTFWMYGDKDWMNEKAGYQMAKEINTLAETKLASFAIIPNAGHHVYLDNPALFSRLVLKFLNFKI